MGLFDKEEKTKQKVPFYANSKRMEAFDKKYGALSFDDSDDDTPISYVSREFDEKYGAFTFPNYEPEPTDRGIIDRVFGMLGSGSIVEGLYNLTDDDESTTFGQGFKEGLRYMNPFENDVTNRNTFSDVLQNLGWEDKDPDKLELSDVGRGVVGFAGDVLLDPLSYINPFSSLAKIAKGSGVTVEGAKAVKKAMDVDTVSEALKKYQNGHDDSIIQHVGMTYQDAENYMTNFYANKETGELPKTITPERLRKESVALQENFNKKIMHMQNGGDDFSVAMPWTSRKKRQENIDGKMRKPLTIFTEKQLRAFGDNTVAPYVNSMLKTMRGSAIGRTFVKNTDLEKKLGYNLEEAISEFISERYSKHYDKATLAALAKDVKVEEIIAEWQSSKSPEEVRAFINAVDKGELKKALELYQDRANIEQKVRAEKQQYSSDMNKAFTSKIQQEKKVADEFASKLQDENIEHSEILNMLYEKLGVADTDTIANGFSDVYTNPITKEYVQRNATRSLRMFGKNVDTLTDSEKIVLNKIALAEDDKLFGINGILAKRYGDTDDMYENLILFAEQNLGLSIHGHSKHGYTLANPKLQSTDVIGSIRDKVNQNVKRDFKKEFERLPAEDQVRILDEFKTANQDDFLNMIRKMQPDEFQKLYPHLDDEIKEYVGIIARREEYFQAKQMRDKGHKPISKRLEKEFDYYSHKVADDIYTNLNQLKAQQDEIFSTIDETVVDAYDDIPIYDEDIARYLKVDLETFQRINTYAKDKQTMEMWKLFDENMRRIADMEVEAGLLSEEQAKKQAGKYIRHELSSEALRKMVGEKPKDGKFNPEILGKHEAFDHSRDFETAEELEQYMRYTHPELAGLEEIVNFNLADLYAKRCMASGKLLFGKQVKDYIADKLYKPFKRSEGRGSDEVIMHIEDLNKFAYQVKEEVQGLELIRYLGLDENLLGYNAPYIKLSDEQIDKIYDLAKKHDVGEDVSLHRMCTSAVDRLNNYSKTQMDVYQTDFARLFDKFTTLWKLGNTLVTPGFHLQNAVSNAFQSFLAIGEDATNPKKLKRAFDIIRTRDPKQKVTLGGREYTYRQLHFFATKTGILDNTFFSKDIDDRFYKNPILKLSTRAGTQIEGVQRFNMMLSCLDQGYTAEEAVEMVNKFLFDYGDLTDVEKNIYKRIIPFYTFMRKNVPLMLEQMIEQPQTFTTLDRAITNFEKTVSGDEYLNENERNEWRQDYIQTGEYGMSNQLPYTQLDRISELDKILGQTNPLIKAPVELMTGEYLYTGAPIDGVGEYLLNQVAPTKIPKNALRKYEQTGDLEEAQINFISNVFGFPTNKM